MPSFSNILCVIDPTSEHLPALDRAAWLAKNTGANLNLLICYYNEYLSGDHFLDLRQLKETRKEILKSYQHRLECIAHPLSNDGITLSVRAIWDHPLHAGIIRHAVAINADVIFKDTHHHSLLSRSLFSNSDWDLIRTCPMPLWLVKPSPSQTPSKIIASIDPLNSNDKPAELDDQILRLGLKLASDTNSEVHAFHAYGSVAAGIFATPYVPTSIPVDYVEEQLRSRHEASFMEQIKKHHIDDTHAHLVSGNVSKELPKLANKLEANVVIMGAVSRNRLKRLFIGSTAESTLEHLPCDLLVVKPSWFNTPVEMSDVA